MFDKDEQDEMPRGPQSYPRAKNPADTDRTPSSARRTPGSVQALSKLPQTLLRGVDGLLLRLLGDYAPMLRSNKPLLFGLAGFLAAALGAILAEFVPHFRWSDARLGEGLYAALYSCVAASFLSAGLYVAGEYYLRRLELDWQTLMKPFLAGAVAGAIAGGVAGFLYGATHIVEYWREVLLRPACWGVLGGLVGCRLAASTPNLGYARASAGGALGGAVGGFAFVFIAILMPQFLGRIAGFGVMGGALGLAFVAADAVFRDAELEVIWAPNETATIRLGERPIYIGGGDDHVSIPGLAEHAIAIVFESGKIRYIDRATGRKTDLKDGSNIAIGRVRLVIHARKLAQNAKTNVER